MDKISHAEMVGVLAKSREQIIADLSPKAAAIWHHATGIATEAGEILDAAKKVAIYGREPDLDNFIEELGDIEFYLQGLRMELELTREQTLEQNILKLGVRYREFKYSNEQALGRRDKG